MRVDPYLFFEGRCDEAIAFYGNAAGAELDKIVRYKDVGGTIRVPLMQTSFASRFGMVADRFGVLWTVVTQ